MASDKELPEEFQKKCCAICSEIKLVMSIIQSDLVQYGFSMLFYVFFHFHSRKKCEDLQAGLQCKEAYAKMTKAWAGRKRMSKRP